VVPAHVDDGAAVLLAAHDLTDRIRARDRALEVDREQDVELALPIPRRRVAGEDVGAGVVDPDVDAAELPAGFVDQPLAGFARAEIGLSDERPLADRVSDLARALGRRAVREQDDGALGREGLGDGAADAAARAGDDGV
jgi:hypothetical protein